MDNEPNDTLASPVNFGAIGSGAIIPGASNGFQNTATSFSHSINSFGPELRDERDVFAFNHSANTEILKQVRVDLGVNLQPNLMNAAGVSGVMFSYTLAPVSGLIGPKLDVTALIGSFSYMLEIAELIGSSGDRANDLTIAYYEKRARNIDDRVLLADSVLAKQLSDEFLKYSKTMELIRMRTRSNLIYRNSCQTRVDCGLRRQGIYSGRLFLNFYLCWMVEHTKGNL